MHESASTTAKDIVENRDYNSQYKTAYPNAEPGNAKNIANAIASYKRTLISFNSRFDKHMRGEPILTKKEINLNKVLCKTRRLFYFFL